MSVDGTKTIRKELKAKGWSSRQVSVRCPHGSIRVVIKDPAVPLTVVKEIADQHRSVDYCQYSGDILSGGNTFVFVSYAREALAPKTAEILALLSDEPGKPVEIDGYEIWRVSDRHQPDSEEYRHMLKGENLSERCFDKTAAAHSLALTILSQ